MKRAVGKPSAPFSPARKEGFALIAALALMAFLVLLIVSLAGLARVETQVGAANRQAAQARQNALFALEEALAQLQASLGDDRSVSARADIEDPDAPEALWTGAWAVQGGEAAFLRWLVSGEAPDPTVGLEAVRPARAGPGAEAVRLAGDDLTGEARAPLVSLRRPSVTGGTEVYGRYAFWVGDENVKARILPEGTPPAGAAGLPEQNAFATFNRRALSAAPFLAPGTDSPDFRTEFAALRVARQAEFINPAAANALRDHPHDLSFLSDGMLVDTNRGGFRRRIDSNDLADTLPLPYFGARRYIDMEGVFRPSGGFPHVIDASAYGPSVPPAETSTAAAFEGFHPIVTEVAVTGGPFFSLAARGAQAHIRVRFHIRIELANPYTFPIDITPNTGSRPYEIVLSGLPIVRVFNVTRGRDLGEINLDDAFSSSGPNRPIHSWINLSNLRNEDGRIILLPGQVVQITEPDPIGQPEGLSRWHNPQFRLPHHTDYGNEGDEIFVTLEFPEDTDGVHFRLVPFGFAGNFDNAPTIFAVTNVPFENDSYEMEAVGKKFFRDSAAVYRLIDYTFGFHYKLFDDPLHPDGLTRFLNQFDLRRPVISYRDNPREIDLLSNLPGEIAIIDDFFSRMDGFASDNAYAPRLYDIPLTPAPSLATLRVAPAEGFPPYALGRPGHPTLNEIFDTHIWLPEEAPWMENNGSDPATTAGVRVQGLFNINSTSAPAWQSVLTHALRDFALQDGDIVEAEAFFARQPFGSITLDEVMDDFEIDDVDVRAFSQGMRLVEADALEALAGAIVTGVRQLGPFGSLEAFLESDLLSDALEAAPLDGNLSPAPPPGSLLDIDAGDLAMKLTPIMSARSDTFVIRTYGDVVNPVTGRVEGRAACEAVVRRYPEFLREGSVQRRFRVVQFRWLDLDTL